ncbi:MAG: redoxin domain-containing protein [Bacteroidota bacterium]
MQLLNTSFRSTFFTLVLLFSIPLIWAQSGPQRHRIEVAVKNYTGEIACMAYYYGDKQYITDTVPITKGAFVFEADTALPGGMYLIFFPPQNDYFEVLVDQDQEFTLETDTLDFVANMKVKGSEENDLFYQDLRYLASKRKESQRLQQQVKAATDAEVQAQLKDAQRLLSEEVMTYRQQFVEAHPDFLYAKMIQGMQDPEVPAPPKDENGQVLDSTFAYHYYKSHFFDGLDLADERLLRTSVLFNRVQFYMDRLTYKYQPDSLIQSIDYILSLMKESEANFRFFLSHFYNTYGKSPIMGMDAVPVHLVWKYYQHPEVTPWISDTLRQEMIKQSAGKARVLVGNEAPDMRVKDQQGQYQTLSQIDAEWIVVYFWSYDCSFCKKITPKLSEAYQKYELVDKGVKLITVNIDGDVEEWKEKLTYYNLDFEGAIHTEDIRRQSGATISYDVLSTPRMFILDREKVIRAKQIGVPQMLQILSHELDFELEEVDQVQQDAADLEHDDH